MLCDRERLAKEKQIIPYPKHIQSQVLKDYRAQLASARLQNAAHAFPKMVYIANFHPYPEIPMPFPSLVSNAAK
jgi:hypothetical protein